MVRSDLDSDLWARASADNVVRNSRRSTRRHGAALRRAQIRKQHLLSEIRDEPAARLRPAPLHKLVGRGRRRRFVFIVAVLLLIGAGTGVAVAVQSGVQPDRFTANPTDRAPVEFVGKTPTQILDAVTARYGGDLIVDARIGGPPADFEPTDGSVPVPPEFTKGKWAYLTVRAPSDSELAIRAIWEADLVAGALRDGMHINGDILYATRTSLLLPDGSKVPDAGGCCGNVVFDQQFDTPTAEAVPHEIERAANGTGLRIDSIEVLVPDQPAPVVMATTDDPARTVSDVATITYDLFRRPPKYEGYYLEVRDASGRPALIAATDFRIGAGHQWIRPDLDPRRRFSSTQPPS